MAQKTWADMLNDDLFPPKHKDFKSFSNRTNQESPRHKVILSNHSKQQKEPTTITEELNRLSTGEHAKRAKDHEQGFKQNSASKTIRPTSSKQISPVKSSKSNTSSFVQENQINTTATTNSVKNQSAVSIKDLHKADEAGSQVQSGGKVQSVLKQDSRGKELNGSKEGNGSQTGSQNGSQNGSKEQTGSRNGSQNGSQNGSKEQTGSQNGSRNGSKEQTGSKEQQQIAQNEPSSFQEQPGANKTSLHRKDPAEVQTVTKYETSYEGLINQKPVDQLPSATPTVADSVLPAQDIINPQPWLTIQRHYSTLRFLATALRTPQHVFHHEAWNLIDRIKTGRLHNTITSLAALGTDIEILDQINRVEQHWGKDWYYSVDFGGQVHLKDPEHLFTVEKERTASMNQVWFHLDMNELMYRGGGWISAISVYPVSAIGNYSVVINSGIWIPQSPDANGVFNLSAGKLAMIRKGQLLPDHLPMYPALGTFMIDTIHIVSDRKNCSANFAISAFDPVTMTWFPVTFYRID